MVYWWIKPWIITFLVAFLGWGLFCIIWLDKYINEHMWPIYILCALFLLWIIPGLAYILIEIIIPIFLAFWFSFKP